MTSFEKALFQILRGASDANVRFDDVRRVLVGLGFEERIRWIETAHEVGRAIPEPKGRLLYA